MLKKKTIEISIAIPPQFIQSLEEYIYKKMNSYLLKYSKKLNGIVLFYKLKGYHNTFPIIKGSGDILVKCILRIFVEEFEDKKIYKVEGNRIFNFYDVEIANKDAEISNNDMEIDEGDNENYFVRIKSIKQKESMFPIFECERL